MALTFEMRIFNTASLGGLNPLSAQLPLSPFLAAFALLSRRHTLVPTCSIYFHEIMSLCHYVYHLSPEQHLFARNWVLRYVTLRTHCLFVSRCLYLSFMGYRAGASPSYLSLAPVAGKESEVKVNFTKIKSKSLFQTIKSSTNRRRPSKSHSTVSARCCRIQG